MAMILIASGDHVWSTMLSNVLTSYRHEVLIAETGKDALSLFEARSPALILLDMTILGGAGMEILSRIRTRMPHVPVVAFASKVSIEMEDHVREMGVSDVLRKELKLDVIMQAIHHALAHAGHPTDMEPVIGCCRTATILVVDDEPVIARMVSEFLRQRGYQTKTVVSGEEALAMIERDPPDLVLLDIYMPGMNGVDVLRKLNAAKCRIGVIMLTASQDEPLLKTALDLGAFDVLRKPIDLEQVGRAVMTRLMLGAKE
ncbi:MAG: response regulator [Gaiellales bacterium]|nr:MAG: response regulator [Gaiellales bacterium]